MRRTFTTRDPVTLNEKIRYKMAFDRRPILKTFADKLAAREYARKMCPDIGLPTVYSVIEAVADLDTAAIPERCGIKPSHGSGALILVDDRAPADGRLDAPKSRGFWTGSPRVRRQQLETPECRSIVDNWLKAQWNPINEWGYWGIPRRVIVEEFLEFNGHVPPDYKFFCFGGSVGFIQVHEDRFASHTGSLHYADWTPVHRMISFPTPSVTPQRPKSLSQMTRMAKVLSRDVDFVRVDLYDLGHRIVFGELTSYPEAGTGRMVPEELFTDLAADWQPHELYGPRSATK